MTSLETQRILGNSRLPWPLDEAYLLRLGASLYGFAYVTSFITEIICYLDESKDRTKLSEKMAGQILSEFEACLAITQTQWPSIVEVGNETAKLFDDLNKQRSDFVHAYPITGHAGEQILHRRHENQGKHFEVTNEFLKEFMAKIDHVCTGLYEIRSIVRPNL